MFTFHYGMPLPKFHLDIPQRNMDVFRRMRNANLSPEFRAYSNSILRMVGSRAVKHAGDHIRFGRAEAPSWVTLRLRQVVGDMSRKALYQTGQMLNGLFAEVNGSTLEFGVRGPRAGVARIQEQGFTIRVTPQMVKGFTAVGRKYNADDIIKWIQSKEATGGSLSLGPDTDGKNVIKVKKRPFLAPALARAAQEVLQSSALVGLDAALVEVISKKILGGAADFDSLNKFGAAYSVRPVK
jgi:hypothetical protein